MRWLRTGGTFAVIAFMLARFATPLVGDMSHSYPEKFVTAFTEGCQEQGVEGKDCGCAVSRLQARYSYGDFKKLSGDAVEQASLEAVSACVAPDPHRYPARAKQEFVDGCNEDGDIGPLCSCMFDYVQERLTWTQFARLMADMEKSPNPPTPPVFDEAATACVRRR